MEETVVQESIFGMYPLAFFALVMVGIFLLYFLYLSYKRNKNAKAVINHVFAFFFTKSGNMYGELCEENKGEVKAPKGHEIGCYYVTPDCTFNMMYPIGKSKLEQISVRCTVFFENDPMPKVSVDPQKWISSPEAHKITGFLIDTSKDESFNKNALELSHEVYKDLANFVKYMKQIPTAVYAALGAAAAAVITFIMVFQLVQKVDAVITMFGGG